MALSIGRRGLLGGFAAILVKGRPAAAQLAVDLNRRSLTGVWRGTYAESGAIIGGEIIFQPNGTYRHTQVLGTLMTWAAGNYSIARNWVHFEIENYGPDEYNGVRQYRPMSETWMVDSFDGDVIDARIGKTTLVHYERAS